MGYPMYKVKFEGVPSKLENGTPCRAPDETDGPHTHIIDTEAGQYRIALTHVDEAGDRVPNLRITFTKI
jgi:hypothetical protein